MGYHSPIDWDAARECTSSAYPSLSLSTIWQVSIVMGAAQNGWMVYFMENPIHKNGEREVIPPIGKHHMNQCVLSDFRT